jgi:hypothetical protein
MQEYNNCLPKQTSAIIPRGGEGARQDLRLPSPSESVLVFEHTVREEQVLGGDGAGADIGIAVSRGMVWGWGWGWSWG